MAEDIDVATAAARPVEGAALDQLPMRDEDGQIRHEFVEEITRAIKAADEARHGRGYRRCPSRRATR